MQKTESVLHGCMAAPQAARVATTRAYPTNKGQPFFSREQTRA